MSQRITWAFRLAMIVGLAIILPREAQRFQRLGWVDWLTTIDLDTTLPSVVFLLFPVLHFLRARRPNRSPTESVWWGPASKPHAETTNTDRLRACVLAGFVGCVSWGISAWLGSTPVEIRTPISITTKPLSALPPSLHDEYSYVFQARTFLAGRLAFSSHPDVPELFDQMHVLNDDGVFASRYFPGTGAWMAPFVAIEKPYWGHWLAGALSAVCVFFIGRELVGNSVGFFAGLLMAASPGVQSFGQLLLAHHPTLLGLTFFAWMFLRAMRKASYTTAFLAGCGLAFAMLCRPMTAAGVGLPFGLWLLVWWLRGSNLAIGKRTLLVTALGTSVIGGIVLMLGYNSALTGKSVLPPYQLYTDIYTPRHVYGFNNVERAKSNTSPKILDNYDRWAENLDGKLAAKNVGQRIVATGRWVFGLVPLAMAIVAFFVVAGRTETDASLQDRRWWIILAAVVSLHVVHIPYWFVGIRFWHYVFEGAPFLVLMFAGVAVMFYRHRRAEGLIGDVLWGFLLIAVTVWGSFGPLPGTLSRVQTALNEDIWVRRNYATFQQSLEELIPDGKALVLIAADPADRHIDYVTNVPALDSRILRGRYLPKKVPMDDVIQAFPDRAVYLAVIDPSLQETLQKEPGSFERIAEVLVGFSKIVFYRLQKGE